MLPSAEKLRLTLEQMGSTADEVATFLEGQGIKGVVGHPTLCPVAMYLYQTFGEKFDVDSFTINREINPRPVDDDGEPVFDLLHTPEPVADFIDLFDGNHFPRLNCLARTGPPLRTEGAQAPGVEP